MLSIDLNGKEISCDHVLEFSKRPTRWMDSFVKSERKNENPALFVGDVVVATSKSGPFQFWAISHDCSDYEDDIDYQDAFFHEFIVVDLSQSIYHRLVQLDYVNYESNCCESGTLNARTHARKAKIKPVHRHGIGFDRDSGWPTFRNEAMQYVTQFVLPETLDDWKVPSSECVFLFWAADNGSDVFKVTTRRINVQTIDQHYADERKRGLWG